MIVIEILVSIIFVFLWNWLVLWVGAKVIGSKEGSWRNCAILTGVGFAIGAIIIGFCALSAIYDFFLMGLLGLAAFIGALWFLARITMNVLDISFWGFVGLCGVTMGVDWFASFLLDKLECIFFDVQIVTDWLPF